MTLSEIVRATGGILTNGDGDTAFSDVSTDSRAIGEGMLFVALIGENFNGHDFAESAINHGAVAAVVSEDVPVNGAKILVKDTLKALGDIATFYRMKFSVPFVGITGSVGKTTTKDMIACVLDAKYNVLKTKGNFNNQIGLPLTLLRLEAENEIAVTEMGMSGFGEIDNLASMVKPSTCVFTNIGMSHIEKLGSRENIRKAKFEMLNHAQKGGNVVYCGDDELLWDARNNFLGFNDFSYGITNLECDVRATDIDYGACGTDFTVCHGEKSFRVHIPVLGEHNVKNALAAYLVGLCHGVSCEEYVKAVSGFTPGNMRQNILEVNGITVINDCYNASPSSVQAGLKILNQLDKDRRKVAVLGDMLEMGEWAEEAHTLVGQYVVENQVEILITVGKNSIKIAEGAINAGMEKENVFSFENNAEVTSFLDTVVQKGDIVLVKGSRGMKLEAVVEHLIKF
ncbi:MAG: UDP-N-acetylmuramoyl-tripeptide--D-alanyl-D-alanine ligase, partial [Clostridia bacterium]|nr:UDP-N-acetylmuramoyl-tripeptide--D-alanyl-D-alanine ligase [Clostridia bacterium]